MRYSMGRQTILSATLPERIISAYYYKMNNEFELLLFNELRKHKEEYGSFGNPNIDDDIWSKFRKY